MVPFHASQQKPETKIDEERERERGGVNKEKFGSDISQEKTKFVVPGTSSSVDRQSQMGQCRQGSSSSY